MTYTYTHATPPPPHTHTQTNKHPHTHTQTNKHPPTHTHTHTRKSVLKSANGYDVTKWAIIYVNSIVSGRNYGNLTSIIAQLLTSQPFPDLGRKLHLRLSWIFTLQAELIVTTSSEATAKYHLCNRRVLNFFLKRRWLVGCWIPTLLVNTLLIGCDADRFSLLNNLAPCLVLLKLPCFTMNETQI